MGGYDKSLTPQEKSEHVMLWTNNDTKLGIIKKISEKKFQTSLAFGLYRTLFYTLKLHIPGYLVGLTSYSTLEFSRHNGPSGNERIIC